jgi:hypothetical protein
MNNAKNDILTNHFLKFDWWYDRFKDVENIIIIFVSHCHSVLITVVLVSSPYENFQRLNVRLLGEFTTNVKRQPRYLRPIQTTVSAIATPRGSR